MAGNLRSPAFTDWTYVVMVIRMVDTMTCGVPIDPIVVKSGPTAVPYPAIS